jgi:hypothetical protein
MKITRRRVEDAMKENSEDCILLGGKFNGRIGERGARNWKEDRGMGKENSKTRWKMQRGEGTDRMDRRKWMGGTEREQTMGRRRGLDL